MACDREFVDLTLPLLPDMELTAMETVEMVGTLMKFDREKIDDVNVALCEACIQAMEDADVGRRRVRIESGGEPSPTSALDGANWRLGRKHHMQAHG